MTKTELLSLLNANRTCYFANVEEGKPHVRAMGMYRADERGLIFQTWTKKDLNGQLANNPEVELCFPIKDGTTIRVSGKMEQVPDLALKKEIEAARPFMTPIIQQFGGYDVVAIWVMKKGRATTWSIKENFAPKTYVEI